MKIEIDYNPTPAKSFFISVELDEYTAVSFDYTSKGSRIIKQVFVKEKEFPPEQKPTHEWDVLVINNGKFKKKYHVKWIDLNEKDWINNEIWLTLNEKPLTPELTTQLLKYSQLICDNYQDLRKISIEYQQFELLLNNTINTLPKEWLD